MAKQQGPILIKGTLGAITFYQREGGWLAKKKTSLNKERVTTDPAFKNSMIATKQFGKASKLAKEIYWQLPGEERGHGVIGKLTGRANRLFTEGYKAKVVKQKLLESFVLTQDKPEDIGITKLMHEVDNTKKVSRAEIIKKLSA